MKIPKATDPWTTLLKFSQTFSFLRFIYLDFIAQISRLFYVHVNHFWYARCIFIHAINVGNASSCSIFHRIFESVYLSVHFIFIFIVYFDWFDRCIYCRYTFCKKLYIKLKLFLRFFPFLIAISVSFSSLVILTLVISFSFRTRKYFFLFVSKRTFEYLPKNRFPLF